MVDDKSRPHGYEHTVEAPLAVEKSSLPCGYEYMVAPPAPIKETARPCGYEFMIDAPPAITGSAMTAATGIPQSYDGSLKARRKLRKAMERRDFETAGRLAEEIANVVDASGYLGCSRTDDYKIWAKTARERKDYAEEVAIVERYFARLPHPPAAVHECEMIDILAAARERLRRYVPGPSTCDMCGAENQSLTRIDSGDAVCTRCLREFKPTRKSFSVRTYDRRYIESHGLTIPNNVSRDDFNRLMAVAKRREFGLPDDAPESILRAQFAPQAKSFHTTVAGVTYANSDGMSRQSIIRQCYIGEQLKLIREPSNRFDSFAVKVCKQNGEQIGYLNQRTAGDDSGIGWCVASDLDAGSSYEAVITNIEGELGQMGVALHLVIGVPPTTSAQFEAWCNEVD